MSVGGDESIPIIGPDLLDSVIIGQVFGVLDGVGITGERLRPHGSADIVSPLPFVILNDIPIFGQWGGLGQGRWGLATQGLSPSGRLRHMAEPPGWVNCHRRTWRWRPCRPDSPSAGAGCCQ